MEIYEGLTICNRLQRKGKKMMNEKFFASLVNYFCKTYCTEYLSDIVITDCLGERTVEISGKDASGIYWKIPIKAVDDRVGIDIGDAGMLHLNGQGLYCYLWNEAIKKITELKEIKENQVVTPDSNLQAIAMPGA